VQYGLQRYGTGWELERVNDGIVQYMVYAALGVSCTECMLYSVNAVLCFNP
jgi:hypothetical protein